MEQFREFVESLPDFFKPWGEEILLRYFDFDGRTDRRTFWQVILINFIISLLFGALMNLAIVGFAFKILEGAYTVLTLIPGIAMQVRRLNDIGKDWPYIFFGFVPCVGWIILLIFYCQDTQY